ncbi:MAG: hypothetical protein K5770_17730 [Lachnospiraceae bacterium]|nr:hypothetical protein [Lachnospiraceae bacterium]
MKDRKYTCTIHIVEPTIKKATARIRVKKTLILGLKNTACKAGRIKWHSSDERIATVDSKGRSEE